MSRSSLFSNNVHFHICNSNSMLTKCFRNQISSLSMKYTILRRKILTLYVFKDFA